jgi:hypothetical protein
MNNVVAIDKFVDALPAQLREKDLFAAWGSLAETLGLSAQKGLSALTAVTRDVTLLNTNNLDPAWGGGWQWNLSDGAVRALTSSVLIATALAATGNPIDVAPILIPAIVPLLFDVGKVRLAREKEDYLRIFGARKDAANRTGTLDELYESLSAETRRMLSKEELGRVLESAVFAGRAQEEGGTFEVLPNGETVFKIRIR